MISNVYIVYDKIADDTIILGSSKTDGMFVRNNAQFLQRMNSNFMNDYDIYCVGTYTDTDKKLAPCVPRLVSWDSYKRPEEDSGNLQVSKN